jgi:hypothetical protein
MWLPKSILQKIEKPCGDIQEVGSFEEQPGISKERVLNDSLLPQQCLQRSIRCE